MLPGSLFNPLLNGALGADVPQFYVQHFNLPAFLIPIYQSAGAAYNVPWQVLAAINQVETNFGTDLNVSSAGAVGWMQFLPGTWALYNVDASGTGAADPYNAADAIFAAARYLSAAGAATNLPAAIYAYNHSDAYVQSVLLRAELLGGMPSTLVDSISTLAEGDFPIELSYHPSYASQAAPAPSADALRSSGSKPPAPAAINATVKGEALGHAPHSAEIFAAAHAAAVAVQAGKVVAIGHSRRLGTYYVRLEDSFGNTYTYGNLASVAAYHLVAKPQSPAASGSLAVPSQLASGPAPTGPATAGAQDGADGGQQSAAQLGAGGRPAAATSTQQDGALHFASGHAADALVFAPLAIPAAPPPAAHRVEHSLERRLVDRYFTSAFGLARRQLRARPLHVGSQVLAGTILGHLGGSKDSPTPHLLFELRPAGSRERLIDPRPFLDAWTQLATLELHRQSLDQPLYGANVEAGNAGAASQLSQIDLERLILGDTHLKLSVCEHQEIAGGEVDRRVLATIEFLVDRGFAPSIAGCTSASGAAAITTAESVTISGLDGTPIAGHTQPGSPADAAVRALAALPGASAPNEIASFEAVAGASNTSASSTGAGAIVVSFVPQPDPLALAQSASYTAAFKLGATRWTQLDAQLRTIPEPRVPTSISSLAVRPTPPAGPTPSS